MKKGRRIIRLDKPARYWDDGLPLGNGRLGAMVMGKPDDETIFINEETLWYGPARDRKNPDAKKYLPEIRRLLREGAVQQAQFLAKMAMTSTPKYNSPYQPAGDLRISFYGHKHQVKDYRRWLDIDRATAWVEYEMEGASYEREHIVSQRYQVLAIRLKTNSKDGLTFCVNMNRKPFEERSEKLSANTVCNYGQCGKGGVSYFTGVRLACEDGSVDTIGDFAYVSGAREAHIYLACGTDFAQKDYREQCLSRLDAAENAGFEKISREHHEDFSKLYGRMDLRFGGAQVPDMPMDQALEETRKGGEQHLPYLSESLFHFARYLMISSSYDCLMPSNLQGIWNGEYVPPWQSQYTININTQMNYWIAEKCNLPECALPLFAQVKRMIPNGRKTAEQLYGCKGVCAHHNTNLWAVTDPEGIFDASPFWPMGLAWLSLHLFEHYEYSCDAEFLREEAIPVMRESVRFFRDYLFENERGELITGPSVSPENTYYSHTGEKGALCLGPSMDTQILRALFSAYVKACDTTGYKDEDSEAAASMLKKLPKTTITADGRIMEWQEDYEEAEPGHRHISHLFALHPGREITQEKPDLFAAAEKTLDTRLANGGGHTGWSCAWIACFFARLKDGRKVGESIRKLLSDSIKINLLDTHPPFQIDGNFGIAEAMLESLVQSHGGYLEFLPALPEFLPEGEISGVVLRGGITADFAWEKGSLISLTLMAKNDCLAKLRYGGVEKEVALKAGMMQQVV